MAEAAPARKVQFTVPPADVTVNEWLDFQYSPSESLRRLIREAVAREGFVDVANRPVRPPRNPVYVEQDFPPDNALTAPPVYDEPEPEAEPDPAPTRRSSSRSSQTKPAATSSSKPSPSKSSSPKAAPAKPKAAEPSADATSASATIDDILGL